MDLNLEKQKFLGNCVGREIININTGKRVLANDLGTLMQCTSTDNDIRPVFKLLKNISDEELLEIFTKDGWYDPEFQTVYKITKSNWWQTIHVKWVWNNKTKYSKIMTSPSDVSDYQWFWDKGYALPWMGLNIETLVALKYMYIEDENK